MLTLNKLKNNNYQKQYRKSYSSDKFYSNNKELDNFKKNIENEIEKLRGYMKEGQFSFHGTYTKDLKPGIENLQKKITECDNRINYYKNNINNNPSNNYYIGIIERLKTSISNLVSEYERSNKKK